MDAAEEFATKVLTAFGCHVESIRESDDKRADLLATDDTANYLVEVKHKLDDPKLFKDHAQEMARGEVVSRAAATTHNNRISGVFRHARDQLDRTPGPLNAFRIIWFHADGIDHDLRWKQAFATFYGRVHLWAKILPGNDVIDCFYFDYSAAWSMPSVVAMILTNDSGVQLCLNEFSDQADQFRDTRIYRRFAQDKSVVDPHELATKGDILACRTNVPRKNDDDVLDALREQTGVLYTVIRFSQHSASVMVGVPAS